MYVAIKGFVLVAWLTTQGVGSNGPVPTTQPTPQATFATLEDCNAAANSYPKEFRSTCLGNVVLQLALSNPAGGQTTKTKNGK
jgi:hypothetical protein